MSIQTIENILDCIKDIRKAILSLEGDDRTDEQNESIETMKQDTESLDHDTRVLEFEINKDI